MYRIAYKSATKWCVRSDASIIRHQSYSKGIAAAYKSKHVEASVAEASDRRNSRLFDVSSGVGGFKGKYTSILPPPNVTGNLHLGHALMATVQDVICRWKLLNGYDVQWIPGLDHAGIATQVVVEKSLKAERNVTRHDIGKNAFVQEVWKWKAEKGHRIRDDLIRLGTIFNWEQEYFTMDENLSHAVVEAFIRLFEANLIYRREAMINWSCALESTISDIEVECVDINGPTQLVVPRHARPVTFGEIFEITYRCMDGDDDIVIATTRPETILGDVAVAVHPNDVRYAHMRGVQFWHPFRDEPIPLVFDDFVDPEIGTGALKITPAHNRDDFAVATRHQLPTVNVFDKQGMVTSAFEKFAAMPRFEARETILDELAKDGLFRGKAPHKMQLPRCSRSHDVIEYFVKAQWFMRCQEAERTILDAVAQKTLSIDPSRFEKEWNRWLSEHRDWCLSRQLWWGHQVPAYECTYENRVVWVAAHSNEEARRQATKKLQITDSAAIQVRQDEDVLDTWFSSGLLPFSLAGWPNDDSLSKTKSYPLDIIVTGHDILFFWVARMALLATQLTNQLPFQTILLHGIVCDANGRKMSKSRGNVITPSQIINGAKCEDLIAELKRSHCEGILSDRELKDSMKEKRIAFPKGIPACSVDALRFTLCGYDVRDHFINFDAKECHKNHKFFNKIWNATRFTLNNCEKFSIDPNASPQLCPDDLTDFDKWILSRLANTLAQTRPAMGRFDFHVATKAWKRFFYENLCDVYLESTKLDLWTGHGQHARVHCEVLKTCMAIGLKQMGVFTPFLSNELLKHLPLAVEFSVENWADSSLEADIETLLDICASIRQLKTESKIMKKHSPRTHLFTSDERLLNVLRKHNEIVNLITFSVETIVHPFPVGQFERPEDFIVQSTAARLCTFGITVESSIPDAVGIDVVTNVRNKKKLDSLLEALQNHRKYVQHFQKNDREIPADLIKDIENAEIEIENLKNLINS